MCTHPIGMSKPCVHILALLHSSCASPLLSLAPQPLPNPSTSLCWQNQVKCSARLHNLSPVFQHSYHASSWLLSPLQRLLRPSQLPSLLKHHNLSFESLH